MQQEESDGTGDLWPCRKCDLSFQTIPDRHQHEIAAHDLFICLVCGKEMHRARDLRGHMASKHGMPKEFQCHVCHKDFTYKHNLQKHIKNLRTWRSGVNVQGGGESTFSDNYSSTSLQCSYCKKLFLYPQSRRNHELRIHQNRYPYVCDICGKGVSSVALLRGHMSSKHNMRKDFHCEICNKEFGYKHLFREHMSKHSGNRY